jgi:hypothetical protein
MKISTSARTELSMFPDERIRIGLLHSSKFCSAGFGEVPVGASQRKHVHSRPSNGDELMLFVSGTFELVTQSGASKFDAPKDGVVFVSIDSGEEFHVRNTGLVPVLFFSVFCPAFELQEIKWTEAL